MIADHFTHFESRSRKRVAAVFANNALSLSPSGVHGNLMLNGSLHALLGKLDILCPKPLVLDSPLPKLVMKVYDNQACIIPAISARNVSPTSSSKSMSEPSEKTLFWSTLAPELTSSVVEQAPKSKSRQVKSSALSTTAEKEKPKRKSRQTVANDSSTETKSRKSRSSVTIKQAKTSTIDTKSSKIGSVTSPSSRQAKSRKAVKDVLSNQNQSTPKHVPVEREQPEKANVVASLEKADSADESELDMADIDSDIESDSETRLVSVPLITPSIQATPVYTTQKVLSDSNDEHSEAEALDMASTSGSESDDEDAPLSRLLEKAPVTPQPQSQASRKVRGGSTQTKKAKRAEKRKQEQEAKLKIKKTKAANKFVPECKFWENGACKMGDKCQFAHVGVPKRHADICKFFLSGSCTKGSDCMYSHNPAGIPCKFFHFMSKGCTDSKCPFSHDPVTAEQRQAFWEDDVARQQERAQAQAALMKDPRQNALEKIVIAQPFGEIETT